jgi:hypothetical protein
LGAGCGGRGGVGRAMGSQGGFPVSDRRAGGRQMLVADGEVVWARLPFAK